MTIYNSTELFKDYISKLDFSIVYSDKNFAVDIESNVKLDSLEAANYLLGAASVGNKVLGFFNEMPLIQCASPLRGVCVFVSTRLPKALSVPIFFCREPDDLALLVPKALKVSVDTGIPVQIVISSNALNNYTSKKISAVSLDRVAPYVSANNSSIDFNALQEKLSTSYAQIHMTVPQDGLNKKISFYNPEGSFPKYIFPRPLSEQGVCEQAKLLISVNEIITTREEAHFVFDYVNRFLGIGLPFKDIMPPEEEKSKVLLCPGCPFALIYASNNLDNTVVYTSVYCPAVFSLFNIQYTDFATYKGIISHKLNSETLFIGNLSSTYNIDSSMIENGRVVLLQDNTDKSPFPVINNINKFVIKKNVTFPYSCNNIKKYSKLKFKARKCICNKGDEEPVCIAKSHCSALMYKVGSININEDICTGCRHCVIYCEAKAIS